MSSKVAMRVSFDQKGYVFAKEVVSFFVWICLDWFGNAAMNLVIFITFFFIKKKIERERTIETR